MKSYMQFLREFYAELLILYPKTFREEYGEELQTVFGMSMEEAARKRGHEVERLILHELASLPKAVVLEHLRERRNTKMSRKFASRFDFAPGSWKEGVAMLAPFVWFAICFSIFFRLIIYLFASGLVKPGINIVPFVVVFWLLGFSLFAFDFVKGPPRWFMPYIGLLLPIFNLFIYEGLIIPHWGNVPVLFHLNRFLGGFIYQGLIWVGLFSLIILLVIMTRLVPAFRLFHQKLIDDWTLLSFTAYGTVPFAVIYSYGDYEMDFANQGPYLLLVVLIFAAGGWFYLRANTPLKKFLPLFGAMALSMFVAELSRAILYEFPRGLQLTWQAKLLQLPWQDKLMETFVMWIWVALFLLFPILLKWLPDVSTPKLSLNEG